MQLLQSLEYLENMQLEKILRIKMVGVRRRINENPNPPAMLGRIE
jgi:hypothetical protein